MLGFQRESIKGRLRHPLAVVIICRHDSQQSFTRTKLNVQTSDNSRGSIPFRLHRELQAVSRLVSSCDHYDKGQLSAVASPSSVCQVGPLFHNLKGP